MQPSPGNPYKNAISAIITGTFLWVVPVLLYVFVPKEKQLQVWDNLSLFAKITWLLGDLFLRVLITGWIKTMAAKKSRDKMVWGLFAFFFPAIVLMVIGFTGKKNKSDEIGSPQVKLERKRSRITMIALFFVVLLTAIALAIGCIELYTR